MPRRRSIYETGAYETPLADLIEKIPDYFMQWEMLKQGEADKQEEKIYRAGRDFIADTKYQDKVTRDKQIYEDSIDQKAFTNELNLLQTLPAGARINAMKTSGDEEIAKLGRSAYQGEEAFTKLIHPIDASLVGEPAAEIKRLRRLLTQPSIANSPIRINQINQQIKIKEQEFATEGIKKFFVDNPDAYKIEDQERILLQATLDAPATLSGLKKQTGIWTPASAVSYYNKLLDLQFQGDPTITDADITEAKKIVDQFLPSGIARQEYIKKQAKAEASVLRQYPWLEKYPELRAKEVDAQQAGSSVIEGRTEHEATKEPLPASTSKAVSVIEQKRQGLVPEIFQEEDLAEGIKGKEEGVIIPAILGDLQAGQTKSYTAKVADEAMEIEQHEGVSFKELKKINSLSARKELSRRNMLVRKLNTLSTKQFKKPLSSEERLYIRDTGLVPERLLVK